MGEVTSRASIPSCSFTHPRTVAAEAEQVEKESDQSGRDCVRIGSDGSTAWAPDSVLVKDSLYTAYARAGRLFFSGRPGGDRQRRSNEDAARMIGPRQPAGSHDGAARGRAR